jgi:hypothetical protein
MANNLTIESPNFEKISKESGQFTADAISLLWNALNDTRAVGRRNFRQATEKLTPKLLTLTPTGAVTDLDSQGASIIAFTSGTQNFTGIRAPQTGESRVMFLHNHGAGTITVKNAATSETANQFATSTGSDYTMSTGKGIIFAYLSSKWREVARSG